MKNTIAIIGAGNMGSAFYRGLKKAGSSGEILISDRHPEKLKILGADPSLTNPKDILPKAEIMILAVKPQSFSDLAKECDGFFANKLIISLMAGITLASLQEKTGSSSVVRSMPNLGSKVQRGLTAWIASEDVSKTERHEVQEIFAAVGKELEVRDEQMIDAFTALAGSGPAYFFHLSELLAAKAMSMGFSQDQAEMMGRETLIASGLLLDQESRSPTEWKQAVRSKGGTTEAALRFLEEHDFSKVFFGAIDAAKNRSQEWQS